MKKIILRKPLCIALISMSMQAWCQDIIVLRSGDEIQAKVMDIGIKEIKYKKHENLTGPLYTLLKEEVFMIKYENGSKDVFKAAPSQVKESSDQAEQKLSGAPASDLSQKLEFYNQVYILTSGNTVNGLEKGNPESKVSTVATPFYAGSTSSWVMAGDRSSVRLNSTAGCAFVIKISPGTDPFGFIRLIKFQVIPDNKKDPSKKSRYMVANKTTGSIGGASSNNITENDVPFELKKISEGIYQIIPGKAMQSGEYAFYVLHKFFAFGIN